MNYVDDNSSYYPRRKDDILLKSAFEDLFPDLLRFFFPDANSIFDFRRKFEFLDKELAELFPERERQGGSRFVDMLVKAFLKTGEEEWILVHIEIQGGNTKGFPVRMFQYWYRIYDRYESNITSLVVFTGGKRQKTPNSFRRSFMGTEVFYRYNIFHIFDYTEKELVRMKNPFSIIILAAQKALLQGKVPEEEFASQRLQLARILIGNKTLKRRQIEELLIFLNNFLYISNGELNHKFHQQIQALTGGTIKMGIIETIKKIEREEGIGIGIEKGIKRKNAEVARNLLLNTDFSIKKILTRHLLTDIFLYCILNIPVFKIFHNSLRTG